MVKVAENGADFGNNGDELSRLTADIHNAKGDENKRLAHFFSIPFLVMPFYHPQHETQGVLRGLSLVTLTSYCAK
jgi:hypothetical protein